MRSLGTNDGPIRALTNEGGAHCQLIANNAVSSRPILRAYAQHSPCIVPCAPLSLSVAQHLEIELTLRRLLASVSG